MKKHLPTLRNSFRNPVGISFLFLMCMLVMGNKALSQVTYTETFDIGGTYPANSLPFGWAQGKFGAGVDADNYWDRMGAGSTNPNCNPRTGTAMMRYRSWFTNAGEAAFLASKRLDMRGYSGTPFVNFWMYRDETFPGTLDNIKVYANATPDMNGTPTLLAETVSTLTTINRACGSAPAVACPVSYNATGWKNYNYNIPGTYNTNSVYIIILGTSQFGANIYIDDFTVQTWPLAQSIVSAGVIFQNTATTAPSQVNQDIIGVKVVTDGYGGGAGIANMIFNTNGSTNPPADITNAKLYYTGGTNTFSLATAQLIGTYTNPVTTNFDMMPVNTTATYVPAGQTWVGSNSFNTLEHGDNYFWITYDIKPAAISGNFVDAEMVSMCNSYQKTATGTSGTTTMTPLNMTGLAAGMTVTGTGVPNNSTITAINSPLAGQITISAPLTANAAGNYIFTNIATPIVPFPQTVAGSREIDVVYCIPTMIVGTSWLNYNTNDYVQSVVMPGNPTAPPGINNNLNSVGPNAGGCSGGPCPFSAHPPDYELFPAVPGKTASLTADGTTNYQITLQVGTYCCSNYIAAFIDFNKNGSFADPGERIAQSGSLSNSQSQVFNFTVPVGAVTGTSRLRVREVWIQPNIDPCATYTYGETEDYVITILPTCGVPGWKTWLGFTDDWDNPANWCGGVPTINDNARLPGSGGPGYTRPVVKPGVFATTKKFRVEANDTLYIKAWNNSSFTASDSMYIQSPSSMVKVITTLIDTAQVSNGLLFPAAANTPLKNSAKAKSVWVFSQAELLAKGMVAGDVVTNLYLHIQRLNSNANPYKNLTISYYYTTPVWTFGVGAAAGVPTVVTAGGTIFGPADVSSQALIPGAAGTWGTLNFSLIPGSFTWNGSNNKLVIELCYDNTGFPNTGASDQPRYTQTLGIRSYCTMIPSGPTVAGCSMTPSTAGVFTTSSDFRPNLTFKYDRPFKKYPISVAGHWGNNGTFVPAISSVTMNGVVQQNIAGTSNSTFYDLKINNVNHVFRNTDFTVTDTLTLTNGRLALNGGTVNLTSTNLGALTRVNGFLYSETTTQPYGVLHWNMGATVGNITFPFVNAAGVYIPVLYNSTAGTHDLRIATYATPPNNLPVPSDISGVAPVVTNINGYISGVANDMNMVNRYWKLDNGGTTPQASITLSYAIPAEQPATGNTSIVAQRWVANANSLTTPGPGWENPYIPGQSWNGSTQVSIPGFNLFNQNQWWTLVNSTTPLPVSLVNFTAKPIDHKVRLDWTTASEVNNSHFIVERSVNQSDFSFIDKVYSNGPTSSITNYRTWDNSPLYGIQYYYLRQYDRNGAMTSYGPVAVDFTKDGFDIITATVASENKGVTVVFNYDSNEPYTYTVIDMLGKTLVTKSNNAAQPGANVIDINAALSKGMYQVILQNSTKVVSRKIFY